MPPKPDAPPAVNSGQSSSTATTAPESPQRGGTGGGFGLAGTGGGGGGGGFDPASHASDVYSLLKPGANVTRRIILPGSTGVANQYQVLGWIRRTLEELNRLFPGRVDSATGEIAKGMFDTYLMFLGENGTTKKVKEEAEFYLVMNDGEPESVEVGVFQDAKLSPRQIGRHFADQIGQLAVEFKLTYAWGRQRGVKDQDRKLSHDCAEYMKDLVDRDHEIIARCKSAAIAAAPVERPLNATASAFLAGLEQWGSHNKRIEASNLDRMLLQE